MSREGKLPIPVDLIRTVAILGVILLHASNDLTNQPMAMMSQTALTIEIFRWVTVDIYQSIGRVGVPIFVMLSGALLLQPSKKKASASFSGNAGSESGYPLYSGLQSTLFGTLRFNIKRSLLAPSSKAS